MTPGPDNYRDRNGADTCVLINFATLRDKFDH